MYVQFVPTCAPCPLSPLAQIRSRAPCRQHLKHRRAPRVPHQFVRTKAAFAAATNHRPPRAATKTFSSHNSPPNRHPIHAYKKSNSLSPNQLALHIASRTIRLAVSPPPPRAPFLRTPTPSPTASPTGHFPFSAIAPHLPPPNTLPRRAPAFARNLSFPTQSVARLVVTCFASPSKRSTSLPVPLMKLHFVSKRTTRPARSPNIYLHFAVLTAI